MPCSLCGHSLVILSLSKRHDRRVRIQVYAGRDPLTGRKRWVSRQVPGKGRAALKRARQVEAELLAQFQADPTLTDPAQANGQRPTEAVGER